MFPLVRRAYENHTRIGVEKLIGAKAVAQEPLDPEAYVKINGELWKARADPAHQLNEQNRRLQVRAASGLTLIVSVRNESICAITAKDPELIGDKVKELEQPNARREFCLTSSE